LAADILAQNIRQTEESKRKNKEAYYTNEDNPDYIW
jgi:hypothetical protein